MQYKMVHLFYIYLTLWQHFHKNLLGHFENLKKIQFPINALFPRKSLCEFLLFVNNLNMIKLLKLPFRNFYILLLLILFLL